MQDKLVNIESVDRQTDSVVQPVQVVIGEG